VGAAAFVLAAGLVIGLGGAGLVSGVTFTSAAGRALRLSVGALLLLLGLVQLDLLPNPLHRLEDWVRPLQRLAARQRRRRPLWGHVLFGFGYLLAGFG
jgi:cytochrome c biogenesis protein CcdA